MCRGDMVWRTPPRFSKTSPRFLAAKKSDKGGPLSLVKNATSHDVNATPVDHVCARPCIMVSFKLNNYRRQPRRLPLLLRLLARQLRLRPVLARQLRLRPVLARQLRLRPVLARQLRLRPVLARQLWLRPVLARQLRLRQVLARRRRLTFQMILTRNTQDQFIQVFCFTLVFVECVHSSFLKRETSVYMGL